MSYHALGKFLDFSSNDPAIIMIEKIRITTYMEDPDSIRNNPEQMKYLIDNGLVDQNGSVTQKGRERYSYYKTIEKRSQPDSDFSLLNIIPWWVWIGSGLFVYLVIFQKNKTAINLIDKIKSEV